MPSTLQIDPNDFEEVIQRAVDAAVGRLRSELPVQEPSKEDRDALLVSIRDAAELMAIGERTLWGLLRPRGPIPAIKIGSKGYRIAVADIEAFIEGQRQASG